MLYVSVFRKCEKNYFNLCKGQLNKSLLVKGVDYFV